MSAYKYRAKEGTGNTVEGVIEAESQEDAIEKIGQLGYLPVRVEETTQTPKTPVSQTKQAPSRLKVSTSSQSSHRTSSRKVKTRAILSFAQQMASLLRAGTPILRALQIVQEATESANFKVILGEMHEEVKNGKSFSAALSHYPLIFPPLYLALVSAGELGGTLDQTLVRIAEHRRKREEIVSRVRSAMIYPALMAFVGAGTIIFMLTFVMPRLMSIFSRLGSELPMPTQILIV